MYANIMITCRSGRGCLHREIFAEEFPIPYGDNSGAINTYHIGLLVKLADLHNSTSFIAFEGVWASLALNGLVLSLTTRGGSRLESVLVCSAQRSAPHVWRFLKCLFQKLQRFTPSIMGLVCAQYGSLVARPKMHIAGESLVSLSGVFRYCSMAR